MILATMLFSRKADINLDALSELVASNKAPDEIKPSGFNSSASHTILDSSKITISEVSIFKPKPEAEAIS